MPPQTTPRARDPRQILVVFNLARRKALYSLLDEITLWMRSQLELRGPKPATDNSSEWGDWESWDGGPTSSSSTSQNTNRDAPLFVEKNPADKSSTTTTPASPSGAQQKANAPPSPALVRLRTAALEHVDTWRRETLAKLREVLAAPEDASIVEQRRKRADAISRRRNEAVSPGESLIDFGFGQDSASEAKAVAEQERKSAVEALQALWHAIPTRLVTVPVEDREEALSCVLLVLLSAGRYPAESRALAIYLASALELPLSVVDEEEVAIAKSLVEGSKQAESQQAQMSAQAEADKRKQQGQASRYWKVGLASVAGAAIIGVTGGLAAPVVAGAIGGIMGSVGLGSVASFLGIFWMNGALVGTLFGAYGAAMTGEMVDQYAREVEDFRFIPLKEEWGRGSKRRQSADNSRRLRVVVGINGWLTSEEDVTKPWRHLGDDAEVFALRYEMRSLVGLGKSLQGLVSSAAWSAVRAEVLRRTVLATLWSALWPYHLLTAATSLDNPFSLARNRSDKAGRVLADALINKVQGERPVTLVGYSLGARVIYACLRSLAERRAFGLIDNVVLVGAPVPSDRHHWEVMRSVVAGHLFNVYSENDLLLAFLYRATSVQLGVAGLQAVQGIEGVENVNLTAEVEGHMRYADLIPKILARCGLPVVEGAAGPIERDGDDAPGSIRLDDLDKSRTGTLVDFEQLAIADTPPLGKEEQPRKSPSTAQRPRMTKPTPSASATLSQNLDPLSGAYIAPEPKPKVPVPGLSRQPSQPISSPKSAVLNSPVTISAPTPSTIVRTASIPSPSPHTPSPAIVPSPSQQSKDNVIPNPPSPKLTSSYDHHHQSDGDDDYSDGEGGFAIKMMDNDDDMAHVDPSPMEEDDDDYLSHQQQQKPKNNNKKAEL